jgi:hypothetical protein
MSQARQQLEVFHDPFSVATSQPKIPDGKAVHSLGQSNQSVGEFRNNTGNDVMHVILFAGQNAGLVVGDNDDFLGTRNYRVFGYEDAGGPDWSRFETINSDAKQEIFNTDGYASWRIVSQGLRLSLLNAAEEDDGWFEAVRITDAKNARGWSLTTIENSTDRTNRGTFAPTVYATSTSQGANIRGRELANEPSYVTGLLRDLKHFQFELHGVLDHHDFTQMSRRLNLWDETLDGTDVDPPDVTTNYQTTFPEDASSEVYRLMDEYVDKGYDMIYIRLHCRTNDAAQPTLNGSQIHYNLVSNQEIIYQGNVRDSRYMSTSSNVGSDACSKHATLRRLRGPAAHMIA